MNKDYIIVQGDAIELMEGMKENSIDMIFTDPPYGIDWSGGSDLISNLDFVHHSLSKKGSCHVSMKEMDDYKEKMLDRHEEEYKIKSLKRNIRNDKELEWEILIQKFLEYGFRILKPGGVIAVFCSGGGGADKKGPLFARLAVWLGARFDFVNAIVWDKKRLGIGWRYRRSYEFVMIAYKPGEKMKWYSESMDVSNVMAFSREASGSCQHPLQKPKDLLVRIIKLHTKEGDIVFDPFCGGGNTGCASLLVNRRFIGIELERKYVEMSCKNLRFTYEGIDGRKGNEVPEQLGLPWNSNEIEKS